MPFHIIITTDKTGLVNLKMPIDLRNVSWSNSALEIQQLIKTKKFNGLEFNKILLDFSITEWADPLPLLSILVALKQSDLFVSSNIIFKLPNLNQASLFIESRFMKFINDEGYISCFKKIGIIENELNNPDFISTLRNNSADLIYNDCTLLKADIIDLIEFRDSEKFTILLDTLTSEIETNLSTKGINAFYLNNIIYKVKSFLNETMDNVKNHAYESGNKKSVGIYVRYRNGLANKSLDHGTLKLLDEVLTREEKSCPKLHREYLDIKDGCVELFVIDSGKGISKSFGNRTPTEKWPLRKTTKDIFKYGKRGEKAFKEGKTARGGLFLLGRIFEIDKDYINLLDCNEFVGGFLPFKHINNEYLDANTSGQIEGTHWIARISWKTKAEEEIPHWYYLHNNKSSGDLKKYECYSPTEYHEVISKVLEKSFKSKSHVLEEFYFIDNRDFRESVRIEPIEKLDRDVIYFPEANLTKNALIDKVYFKILNNDTILSDKRSLIIADIPDDERVLYYEAFNNFNLSFNYKPYRDSFRQIFMVTKRLRICCFEKKDNKLILCNSIKAKECFDIRQKLNLYTIFSLIKTYDSKLFWDRIETINTDGNYLIKEAVKWNNEIDFIHGYLNFSEVLTDRFVENLFLFSLERILGFMPNQECVFNNMDVITKQITNHANAIFIPHRMGNNGININVGSIFVTGQNERNALWGFHEQENAFNIHFFVHFQSLTQPISFFNWGVEKLYPVSIEDQYERIGKSHVIARGGYKSIKIPRYDDEGHSVYYRNPVQSYYDWQNTKLSYLKIGNFEYENNYDLFKIDLFKAIKHGFHYCNELSEFLISHFFIGLGGNKIEQLEKPEFWTKIESILTDPEGISDIQNKMTIEFCHNTCLFVYPYHPNTSYAIKKVKECISEDLSSKIIQLTPIKTNHSGSSFLFSPESFLRIKNTISKQPENKREVILFDDSLVSGRTRKEIKHILLDLGATKVKTLAIIDRFRLPYAHQSLDRNRFYWRLDVPRLGNKNTNLINRALKIAVDFSINVNQVMKERIRTWEIAWGNTSVYLDSPMLGINPSYIKLKEPFKSFSLRYDKSTSKYIQISHLKGNQKENMIELVNSYGLTVNSTEIHTLTGQDNRAFLYASGTKGVLSNGAKIELLCTQLLLFPKEFPKEIQFEMIKILYDTLEEYEISNNHTILAAITILIQDEIYTRKLIDYVQKKNISLSYIDCNNSDLRILLSYFVHLFQISNSRFNFISNCIISDKSILNIYKRLHFELFQEREIHYSPIIALYKKKDKPLNNRLDNALHSLINVKDCLQRLIELNYQRTFIINNSILDTINLYIKDVNIIVSKYYASTKPPESVELENIEFINKIIENIEVDIVKPLIKIHEDLFFKVSVSVGENPNFIKELNDIRNTISEKDWLSDAEKKKDKISDQLKHSIPVVSYTENAYKTISNLSDEKKNIWIFYDFNIKMYIRDLIANAIYSYKVFDNETIHYKIDIVKFEGNYLRISFKNITHNPSAAQDANKMTLLREHFEQLNGLYSNSLENKILTVNIDIPLI